MNNTIFQKIKLLCALAFCLGALLNGGARAQSGQTEAAAESQLLQIMLPTGAQRVLPESVPAEITQTLARVTAAGNGKFRQGDSEVLVWGGDGYNKANASRIVNRLTGSLKSAGWQYGVQGEEGGVTVFTALKESPRRAVVGLYGATDDALILAAMEILPNNGNGAANAQITNHAATADDGQTAADSQDVRQPAQAKPTRISSGGGSIIGEWSNGYSSIWSGYVPTVGPKTFTPGKSHYWKYSFHADGTFEFVGLLQTTMYNCTLTIFQDKRGKYAINGNQITLTKTKNFFRKTDSCAASGNMEREYNLEPETYTLNVKRSEYGKEQVCLDSGGGEGSLVCYERAEK